MGHYQIIEPVGAGGIGEVYRALDTRLDRVVAVKLLIGHWAADLDMRQRFEREARIIGSLRHPTSACSTTSGSTKATISWSWSIWKGKHWRPGWDAARWE